MLASLNFRLFLFKVSAGTERLEFSHSVLYSLYSNQTQSHHV
jgi:hypothetical protein